MARTTGSATRCEPRWATPRTPGRESFGPAIAAVAAKLGQPLMPWQRMVADVGGEIDPDTGLPAYREVLVTVPRQSGKTTLILSWEIQRAIGWGSPQRIVYSAQTGNDARKKLIEDQVPLLEPRKKALRIRRILKGMGNESVEFLGGSRIVLLASSEDSGHGKTLDLGVKDELFADADDRRDQAMVPAMNTRAAAQMLTASTMGTAASVALNSAVARGRAAVEQGLRTRTAYFEWSALPDADPGDPAVWRGCMPALGYTITEDVIEHAYSTMSNVDEFKRAYLNIPNLGIQDVAVIPLDLWSLCEQKRSPSGSLAYALDVAPEGRTAAVVASDGRIVEVVAHREGTSWIVPACLEKRDAFSEIVIDPTGAAGALVAPLQSAGIVVRQVSTREHVQAAGGFLNAVINGDLAHLGQPELTTAVAGAGKRDVGDGGWLWSRKKSSVDISPLVAATLARWAATALEGPSAYEERGMLTLG